MGSRRSSKRSSASAKSDASPVRSPDWSTQAKAAKIRCADDRDPPYNQDRTFTVRRSVIVAVAVGLAAIAVAFVAVLTHSPLTVASANSASSTDYVELEERGKLSNCQPAGPIPQGTSAIRLGIEGLHFSPAVTVRVLVGSRVIREGRQIAGGPSIPNVTVPVASFAHTLNGARICTTVGPAVEPIRYYGTPRHTSVPQADALAEATLHAEYLRPGMKSWSSFVPSIIRHMGLGHAPSGTWVAYLLLILMLGLILIVVRVTLRELR
jgi:hypothetical protein